MRKSYKVWWRFVFKLGFIFPEANIGLFLETAHQQTEWHSLFKKIVKNNKDSGNTRREHNTQPSR